MTLNVYILVPLNHMLLSCMTFGSCDEYFSLGGLWRIEIYSSLCLRVVVWDQGSSMGGLWCRPSRNTDSQFLLVSSLNRKKVKELPEFLVRIRLLFIGALPSWPNYLLWPHLLILSRLRSEFKDINEGVHKYSVYLSVYPVFWGLTYFGVAAGFLVFVLFSHC